MDILVRESLYESKNIELIDYKKIQKYARAIETLCDGEYGDVYYNKIENKIIVNLGDSNPFDDEYLKEFMLGAIAKKWDYQKEIDLQIEDEIGHPGKGWEKI